MKNSETVDAARDIFVNVSDIIDSILPQGLFITNLIFDNYFTLTIFLSLFDLQWIREKTLHC